MTDAETGGDALRMQRRRILQSILACAAGAAALRPRAASPAPKGHTVNLPAAQDLHADGAISARDGVPVLLFFDRGDCPYCERALREFLVPMATGDDWRGRAIYRQVEIDQTEPLVDFAGAMTTHRAFAQRHRIELTPTIYLVDSTGAALGKPLVGLMTPDFYGAYLEDAIASAAARLRATAKG